MKNAPTLLLTAPGPLRVAEVIHRFFKAIAIFGGDVKAGYGLLRRFSNRNDPVVIQVVDFIRCYSKYGITHPTLSRQISSTNQMMSEFFLIYAENVKPVAAYFDVEFLFALCVI